MNRNRIRICGRKTRTLPTPEITPFWMKLCSRPSGSASCTSAPSVSNPNEIRSISGLAQANTAWNMMNSRDSRIRRPATGWSRTASTRPVSVSVRLGAPAAPHRDRGHYRHAELVRKCLDIDVGAAPPRNVDHVKHQQHGTADLFELD